ncbi:MAG: cytochrome c-type biogenesis protein CcmH [Hyphomonadaceae bacterium]|nr:cytochrome c-type biogenesis protein CcmH [Hyphomonadaceae bacterium]
MVAPAALADPAQEARAQALEREIRCVQCQNEPIAQSTADIARDMRDLVRERVAAGDSDAEIRSFFRTRYGDFVLFRPPFDSRTWILWGAPLVLLAGGLAAVLASQRRRRGETGDLSPEEGDR